MHPCWYISYACHSSTLIGGIHQKPLEAKYCTAMSAVLLAPNGFFLLTAGHTGAGFWRC